MKIGVFDSGVGGLSVARAIERAMPEHEVIFRNDSEHVPYGTRSLTQIHGYITPIFQALIDAGCQVIVVACNTVSTTLITELRDQFTIPLVAVEPMVKTASELTNTGVIAVCATPNTLKSERYKYLKTTYTSLMKVLEPDCSDWAAMIEQREVDKQQLAHRINEVLDQGADVIVLGCTHYHWIEREIKELAAARAVVIQPEPAVIKQLQRVINMQHR